MSTLTNTIKQRLHDGDEPLYGLWLSLGCDSVAEALAHAGYDWLCIDMEHAPNDSRDVASQLRRSLPRICRPSRSCACRGASRGS